ncbi:MAG: methionine--tRNA ligase [Methanobacteriota archaeon]|nr:MAG: methionine--tRNA ligase [Euryarchaeota archaeon]
MTEEKYIVTSALPYINGVKHIGNLIGSLLPADIYARYLRLKGKDVVAICGTDEHGTPAELSALKAGLPVKEYCDQMYKIQKDIYERFNLSFDYFGRTSDIENHEITQEIFLALYKNGYIFEKETEQLYSVDDDRFLPDRYVIGTCPHCGYERARGDQCEGCSTLLNPTELINPRSEISGSTNIIRKKAKHLYIDLPKIQPKVEAWVKAQTQWPLTTKSIAEKWLKEGLKPRAITRNLKWGIKVPLKGYEDVVFYVWFDAPIGYISITKKWAKVIGEPDKWLDYWKNPNTTLIQFMGIDNVPFHTVTFPSSLIGSDLGYILPKHVKGFQWLTYEGGKFSTSQNRGIFTDQALELYPADYWRYYLTLIAPERQDTDFIWEKFQEAVNSDLNNLYGNLLSRAVAFTEKHFDGIVPAAKKSGDAEKQLWDSLKETITEYETTFDQIEFQKPLKAVRTFLGELNRYFQASKPWETIKSDPDKAATTISTLVHALRSVAILSAPIIPESSEKIFKALGASTSVHEERWENIIDSEAFVGNKINNIGYLFRKIQDKEIEELKKRFGSREQIDQGKKKKKKKENEKKQKQSKYIKFEDFEKVKLKTAVVLQAEKHPKSEKLLILTVDDGERKDRTIVAGIAKYYNPDQLLGQTICIVDNLKPKKLAGVKSEGMLLAVEDKNGDVVLIQPSKNTAPGLRLS